MHVNPRLNGTLLDVWFGVRSRPPPIGILCDSSSPRRRCGAALADDSK
jgi:hypothetical protein